MPMNSSESPVNRLTSSFADKVTHTPAYKEASVRLLVLGENGDSPLPRGNPRFGHRRPNAALKSSAMATPGLPCSRQPHDISRDKNKTKRKRRLKITSQPSINYV